MCSPKGPNANSVRILNSIYLMQAFLETCVPQVHWISLQKSKGPPLKALWLNISEPGMTIVLKNMNWLFGERVQVLKLILLSTAPWVFGLSKSKIQNESTVLNSKASKLFWKTTPWLRPFFCTAARSASSKTIFSAYPVKSFYQAKNQTCHF